MEIRFDVLITQIIGFVIVVLVLRRYAWTPVLNMLDERQARIAADVAAAEGRRREAELLKAQYEEQIRGIEAQARQRIQEAVAEGQRVADEIKVNAHREARVIAEQAREDLVLEYKKARAALRADMVEMALEASERLLQEKIDHATHRRLVDRFLGEIQEQKTA